MKRTSALNKVYYVPVHYRSIYLGMNKKTIKEENCELSHKLIFLTRGFVKRPTIALLNR